MDSLAATADAPSPPPWGIIEVFFSIDPDDTNSEVVVMCHGKRFIIYISADGLADSPPLKEKYLFFLQVLEAFELDGYTEEDFHDWALEPLIPVLKAVPPPEEGHEATLQDFFFPETQFYGLRADSDKLTATPRDMIQTEPRYGFPLTEEFSASWPTIFHPNQVKTWGKLNLGPSQPPSLQPRRVFLKNGTVAFLKTMTYGEQRTLKNELETYRKINEAGFDDTVRTSRLVGLLQDESGWFFGLLLTYVGCKNKTLSCAKRPDTPKFLRQKWTTQIQDIVRKLHAAGITWGDVKPENVLIDRNDDVWVIDFGGGYTPGWVPKEMAGTLEGDLQGMEKMVQFLRVESGGGEPGDNPGQ